VSPQISFECPELLDPPLDLGKLRRDQLSEPGAQVLAASGVRIGGDLSDARQREADLLGTADELKALQVPL
jgi:hypothetical protein